MTNNIAPFLRAYAIIPSQSRTDIIHGAARKKLYLFNFRENTHAQCSEEGCRNISSTYFVLASINIKQLTNIFPQVNVLASTLGF